MAIGTKSNTTNNKPKILPHSIEAEQSVLGSMLIDADCAYTVFGTLDASDFYDEAHKIIFDCMRQLNTSGKNIDFVTVSSFLSNRGSLERIGDIDYLTHLTTVLPSSAGYMSWVEIVKENSILRQLVNSGQQMAQIGYEGKDATTSVAKAETIFFNLSTLQDISSLKSIASTLGGVIQKIETIQNSPDSLVGLPTGFVRLDLLTNGLQNGDLVILAARPSVGKTAFALNIATNVALVAKKKVAFFGLEMPREQLVQRILCATAKVRMDKMLSGNLNNNEWNAIYRAKELLADNNNIYIDDSSLIRADEILSRCRRLQRENGLDLVVIDYLQLMQGDKRAGSNRVNEVSDISRMLKIAAKELKVPVIALSQLSRDSEKANRKPMLSDLRESGAIEQDADIVMFLHKKYDGEDAGDGVIILDVAKHRNGATADDIRLKFVGATVSFHNMDADANKGSILASMPQEKESKKTPYSKTQKATSKKQASDENALSDSDAPPV